MKKTWLITIALMLALVLVCASCGGSGKDDNANSNEEEAAEEAVVDELPSVTAPPVEAGEETIIGAEENSRPDPSDANAYETWLSSLSEEQRYVEENLVGQEVDALIEYLGEPKSTTYVPSCIMAEADDGVFVYDAFSVQTTRFPNGTEYIMGTVTD